jgi:cell division control protein 11
VLRVVLERKFFYVCWGFPTANQICSDSSMNPEDLASQSVRLKEEQLRREEEKLREIEVKVQREINEKRQELLARESQLKEIEARMHREQSAHLEATNGGGDRRGVRRG